MVKVEKSFSQPFIPKNVAIRNSVESGTSFSIDDGPAIQESEASMPFVALGGTKSSAFDVAALLAAVGEQMQYIEFNSVHRELEPRQRWPLLRIVSELLDQPERPADVAKSVVFHKDGTII